MMNTSLKVDFVNVSSLKCFQIKHLHRIFIAISHRMLHVYGYTVPINSFNEGARPSIINW